MAIGVRLTRFGAVSISCVLIVGLSLTERTVSDARVDGRSGAADGVAVASVSSGTTSRVSVDSSGAQSNNESVYSDVSDDGRYVVYESQASNLVTGDTNGHWDIFLFDRQTSTTSRVSVSSSGSQANGDSRSPSISGDGHLVTFASTATNLVDGDTNGYQDVFIRDLLNGTTTRIVGTNGVQGDQNSYAFAPMSYDGRYTVFISHASFDGVVDGIADAYVHDSTTGETLKVAPQAANPDISSDGVYVTFTTDLSLVPQDTNGGVTDVYRVNRTTGSYDLVSIGTGGAAANQSSSTPVISGDGNLIAFASNATNLVSADTDGVADVFVRDISAGATALESVDTSGAPHFGNAPAISRDGHVVAFRSNAALDPADTNGQVDVYARDLQRGETTIISVANDGTLGNSWSEYAAVSSDGSVISFYSYASNLVSSDTNATRDIFVNDRSSGLPDFGSGLPHTFGAAQAAAYSPDPVNLATGSFTSHADDLVLPGRVVSLAFTRWYNSADDMTGPLGPGWTHSYNWSVTDHTSTVDVRRGDGRRDTYTRNQDGSYADPPNVFDTLTKNVDATFTLTLANQLVYEFSTTGQLTRVHEPAGNQITLAYTGGNLTTITDTVGRQVALSYDGSSRLTQIQDPLGRDVTYAYDANGRLATVTDKIGNAAGQNPALHQWKYAYDGTTRHITTVTDPDSRVRVTNSYDSQGRVYLQLDGLDAPTQMAYSTGETILTDPRGHQTTYTFDSRMRVLSQTDVVDANTYTVSYVYDASGNRTSVTDRNGKTADFTYDTRGNVLTKLDPQVDPQTPRYLTQFAYDAKNNLTQITDPLNFVTTMTYDGATNVLLSVSRQIDATTFAVTKYEYADPANPGLPTRAIAPRGNTAPAPDYAYATALTYDAQGNLVTRIDPDAAKSTFVYDGAGRLSSFVDPDGYAAGANPADHTWLISYDENDRETSRTDPLGNVLGYGYDGAGDRTTVTDRRANITTYSYDANTRLATTLQKPDPAGQTVYTTVVTRDANGNATQITQANGVVTDYGFDALNRLTSVTTHPDAQTNLATSYILDGNGQPTSRTTGDNVTVTYGYDALSRLTSVASPGLTTITYAYDGAGQRLQMVDGTGTTTYRYDGLGRATQVAAPNGTLTYAYDLDGNRTTLGYPGSENVTYAYTAGGRLDTVTDWASRISTYTYQPSGLVSSLAYPNGMRASYTYDHAQRLTQLTNSVGSTTITQDGYTLDPEGTRTALDEYVQGITPPVLTWSASVQVNDNANGQQDRPAIAIGADGATYLIWDDYRSGTNGDIYFSRRDPSTGVWSANQKVNNDATTRTQWEPAIALDGSNNAYAVWSDQRDGNKTPDTNIYFSKRTASTGTWNANVRVNNDTTGSAAQGAPAIAVKASGDAVSVFEDHRSNQNNIYSSRLPAGSSTWAANLRVTDNTSSHKYTPDITMDSDGTAYVVWEDDRSGNSDIWFSTLPWGSSTWTANVKISDDPGSAAQYDPHIGIDSAGDLIVIWQDDRVPNTEIRMRRRLAGSQTWDASIVASDAAAIPVAIALGVSGDGNAFAVWQDARGTSYDIWGVEYTYASNSWSTPSLVSDDPGATAQMRPTVARSASEVATAWRDDRVTGGDIRARRRTTGNGMDHFAYSFDGLNRLTSVSGAVPESFNFDAATNISSRTGPVASNTFDQANRQTSDGTRSFVWNAADRLASRGADTFAYDALSRLTNSTTAGISRTYSYNGDGLLASQNNVALLWDATGLPSELISSGSDRVVYGLAPLYMVRGDSTTRTFARNGLGSIVAELSDGGAVLGAFRYSAYGATVSVQKPTLLGYAGEVIDDSGEVYLRARWYDPITGRFISSDSWLGDVDSPMSLNSFAYASADPVNVIDPSGRCPFCLLAIVLANPVTRGAIIGAVSYGVGLIGTNLLEGRPLGSGYSTTDLLISTAAGALTGGIVPPGTPALERLVVGGVIGGGTEGIRQFATGQFDTTRIEIAIGVSALGGLYSVDSLVAVTGANTLTQLVQNLATDVHLKSQSSSPATAPASPASPIMGGK